nr:UPF0715 family protein [Bacillus subtilis]
MTLGLSSLTFGLFLGFYSFVMYGDMIIALFTAAIAYYTVLWCMAFLLFRSK